MELKVVSFALANEKFALDIMNIDSIVEVGKIVRLPESADYVEGVMNLRGNVIPIINMKKKFSMPETGRSGSAKIIVVNMKDKKVGLLVDQVHEVLTLTDEQIEPPPTGLGGTRANFILGIAKINEELLIILNAEEILSKEEKIALQSLKV
ncbi:chemotaxis protein CheW [Pseudothermotoga sp.]|uniref:chemotaxis protein CheW n=1 Tax=Pseudothermotoga sp. TaxID=2033661 RepID=UPI0029999144|nr:chemotaxis protein CheW [Pseudothermotoga sp.]MCX7813594.1 chemotaxis protein CheW [Pseudothermotoga sp.]MDW8140002.1 chemotaxis protein CheW [Pseudothermotoga sp.]